MASTVPIPSPWKTLRRTAARLALALLALILIWSLWYAYAAYRLHSKLAEYRAQGYPISAADIDDSPTFPKDSRPALIFAAASSMSLDQNDIAFLQSFNSRPEIEPAPAEMQTLEDLLKRNASTLDLLEKARSAPAYIPPTKPRFTIYAGPPRVCRRLLDLRHAAAIYHHSREQDRLAIEAIRDMHLIASTCDAGRTIFDHSIAVFGYSSSASIMFRIASTLHLESAADPNGVPRAHILDLIHDLADPKPVQDNLVSALVAFRSFDSAYAYHEDSHAFLLRPTFRLDDCRWLAYDDACIAALGPGVPSFQAVRDRAPKPLIRADTNLQDVAFPLSPAPAWPAPLTAQHYTALTNRQAAALRLALRLYELDHHGELPATLSELIPDYLPAMPIDFFRRDSGPLTYVPSRRLFYSVNEDGTDDGGKLKPGQVLVDWNQPDAVFPLDLPPRLPTTAPATVPSKPK